MTLSTSVKYHGQLTFYTSLLARLSFTDVMTLHPAPVLVGLNVTDLNGRYKGQHSLNSPVNSSGREMVLVTAREIVTTHQILSGLWEKDVG